MPHPSLRVTNDATIHHSSISVEGGDVDVFAPMPSKNTKAGLQVRREDGHLTMWTFVQPPWTCVISGSARRREGLRPGARGGPCQHARPGRKRGSWPQSGSCRRKRSWNHSVRPCRHSGEEGGEHRAEASWPPAEGMLHRLPVAIIIGCCCAVAVSSLICKLFLSFISVFQFVSL